MSVEVTKSSCPRRLKQQGFFYSERFLELSINLGRVWLQSASMAVQTRVSPGEAREPATATCLLLHKAINRALRMYFQLKSCPHYTSRGSTFPLYLERAALYKVAYKIQYSVSQTMKHGGLLLSILLPANHETYTSRFSSTSRLCV